MLRLPLPPLVLGLAIPLPRLGIVLDAIELAVALDPAGVVALTEANVLKAPDAPATESVHGSALQVMISVTFAPR